MAARIELAIRQNAGLIAGQILEGDSAGADDGDASGDLPPDDEDGTVTAMAGGGRRKRGS
jgi:hypothetical protein